MVKELKGTTGTLSDKRVGIVVSSYHRQITGPLLEGAVESLLAEGVEDKNVTVAWVPGAWELPMAARRLIACHTHYDAVICLGCVIKGETSHNEYINQSVATALANMSIATGKPFIFGVLTPNDQAQALDRAGGKHGNKGVEAGVTAIRMAALKQKYSNSKHKIGFS